MDSCASPLMLADLPVPRPDANEILIRISVCGVCHTELDEIEGRLAPTKLPIVLGHQVVGQVEEVGSSTTRFELGDRVGVGWIHSSDGTDRENLSTEFQATGKDVNGGYAEYMTVDEDYAYHIPDVFSDVQAAPLLCAGAIGYRALKLTEINNGNALGLMGFGGSAHLVLQLSQHLFPKTEIYVFARDAKARKFALDLGAAWSGDTTERSPVLLDSIIDTTPAWDPVVQALTNLRPGGRLVINAIRKEESDKDCLKNLSYETHLWMEREIKSVANVTASDISEFLKLAAEIPLRPKIECYQFEDANLALRELKTGSVRGAKVLLVGEQNSSRHI